MAFKLVEDVNVATMPWPLHSEYSYVLENLRTISIRNQNITSLFIQHLLDIKELKWLIFNEQN